MKKTNKQTNKQNKTENNKANLLELVKGTITMILAESGRPIKHFQKQGNIYISQNKSQNSCKFPKIMKKTGRLASFIPEGYLTVFLILYLYIVLNTYNR